MADPFVNHNTAARLSLATRQCVCSRTSMEYARMSLWAITPVGSKSEMEIAPRLLENRWRQRMGGSLGRVGSHQLPMSR